jgi:WD40 repeat protein/predicted Ser/Thr protein kinase
MIGAPLVDEIERETDGELDRSLRRLSSAFDGGAIAELRRALVKDRVLSAHAQGVRAGRFRVLRQLGAGAMGAVYEAHDELLDRKIALKLVRAENEEAKLRVAREARALAKVNNPHVVAVHEIGEHEGQLFIAMELVIGRSLEEWMREAPHTWEEILAVYLEAGRGLCAAHAGGVIHRDFKPANVLLGEDHRIRVADFGLAARSEEELGSSDGGTPGFIAPELRRGEPANEKTDQYSFAISLYRALFEPPRGAPFRISKILERGFDEAQNKRWPSLDLLLAALAHAAGRGARRKRTARILAALSILAATVFVLRLASAGRTVESTKASSVRVAAELAARDPRAAAEVLLSIPAPENTPGWREAALATLLEVPIVEHRPKSLFPESPFSVSAEYEVFRRSSDGQQKSLRKLPELNRDPKMLWSYYFSPQGAHLAAVSSAETVLLFDLQQPSRKPSTHTIGVRSPRATYSANERVLVLWNRDDRFQVVDLTGRAELRLFHNPEGELGAIGISNDGRFLITGPTQGPARLWSLEDVDPLQSSKILGHGNNIFRAEFSPDNRRALTASHDRTLRVWDLDTHRYFVLGGRHDGLTRLRFNADASKLETRTIDGLRVYDLRAPRSYVLPAHDGRIWSAVLSHDRTLLATAGFDSTARIWDLEGQEPVRVLRAHTGSDVYSVAFSNDDRRLATAGNDGTARVWDAATGEQLNNFAGHMHWAYGLAFSPDGRWLATGDKSGALRLWPLESFASPRVLEPGCSARIKRLDLIRFSADGSRIAAQECGCDGGTCIYRLDTFQVESRITDQPFIDSRALQPFDERRWLLPHAHGALQLWDAQAGRVEQSFGAGHGRIFAIDVSPDRRLLAAASANGTAQIYDLGRTEPIAILSGHQDWVVDVRFDPEGRRVITASYDGTARVFDLDRPGEPLVLRGHTDKVRFAAFARGRKIVTASFDGTVRVWNIDLDQSTESLTAELTASLGK